MTNSNLRAIEKTEKTKKEIVSSANNITVYNNWFMIFIIIILGVFTIALSWKLSDFDKSLRVQLWFIHSEYEKISKLYEDQSKVLKELQKVTKFQKEAKISIVNEAKAGKTRDSPSNDEKQKQITKERRNS